MPIDPERLRALAEARRARLEEQSTGELAQFKAETLPAFCKWLESELDRIAGFGSQSATLRFDAVHVNLTGQPGWHAYVYSGPFHLPQPADSVFRVGPHSIPIDKVVDCVLEETRKAGITADPAGPEWNAYEVRLSW